MSNDRLISEVFEIVGVKDSRMLRDELRALVAAHGASFAQPINTAPKDGTPIFLWTNKRWIEGRWDDQAWGLEGEGEGGWMLRWAEIDSYGAGIPHTPPTHWMPVPADPTRSPK